MLALCFSDRLQLRELPVPAPAPDEALVRVHMAGICNTDLEIVRGYMGFSGVLGHEFVGEVAECAVAGWQGRRVVGEINVGCGTCDRCTRDMARHCAQRKVLGIVGKDGCFAEYLTLPMRNLLPVPDSVSDEQAVFTEPLAASFEILEQLPIDAKVEVAVIGDGKLGSLIAQVLRSTGASVLVVGKHRHKLAKLAAHGFRTSLLGEIHAQASDVVVEASGHTSGFEAAMKLVRPRGTIVLKSTFHERLSLDAAPLVIHEIRVLGSRCGRFAPALRALEEGRIEPRSLIDHRFPLNAGMQAFAQASQTGVQKVLLNMI